MDHPFSRSSPLTGKPLSVVLKDLGYKLGHFSLDGLQMPDGMQLVFANIVFVIIEEMGWVEEPNGTPYFSFSGGVAIGFGGGNAVKPSGNSRTTKATASASACAGCVSGSTTMAPALFKIDGIFLKLKYAAGRHRGLRLHQRLRGQRLGDQGVGLRRQDGAALAGDGFLARRRCSSRAAPERCPIPRKQFDYFLAALELGFLPAGPVGLYDIRALVADNMAPNLDSTFPDGEGMALLKWHQNHDDALSMPANRTLADWIAEKDCDAAGIGCGFSLNGAAQRCT